MTSNSGIIATEQGSRTTCKHTQLSWRKIEANTRRGIMLVTWCFQCSDCGIAWDESAEYTTDEFYQVTEWHLLNSVFTQAKALVSGAL